MRTFLTALDKLVEPSHTPARRHNQLPSEFVIWSIATVCGMTLILASAFFK